MSVTTIIAYDPQSRQLVALAEAVAQGVSRVPKARALLRPVPEGTVQELTDSDALILGSPNFTGISGPMKAWLDSLGDPWKEGWLLDKPGGAFTRGTSRNAGIEFTLWSLLHWLLAGGMIVVGLPFSERMTRSGSYYGATATGEKAVEEDMEQARDLGERVAHYAVRLKKDPHPLP